nr:sugar transferase [Bacteroidota bacterium]
MSTVFSKNNNANFFSRDAEFIVSRSSTNLLDPTQTLTKRIFDVVLVSLFLLFVGSWLFALIAICIRLESKGPVIFKQLRHGQDNVPFYCLKFRSMRYNPKGHFKQASKNDPRITGVGSFLRKTSLDELPQLFNILIGNMTLVGPRPHAI